MAQSRPLSVGMDVHQASIAVADVAPAWGAAVVSLGTVGTRQGESAKRIRPLQAKSTQLVFVDAAGPCGSWLSRSLTTTGHGCWVVAPSLLPQKTGDRGTTARRDAMQGARLLRSGDRTPVSVPAVQDAAMRDLSRARAATRHALKTATVRLTALLRRHAIRSTGRAPWGPAPLRWRREVVGPPPAQHLVCQAYGRAGTARTARRQRLEQARHAPGTAWRLGPVVDALPALRGVPCPVAVTTVAARGDLPRVATPRPRMQDRGLPPAASSSGARRRQGGITQTGPRQARRALLDGAWASRSPAKVSRPLPLRLAKLPKPIQDVRWTAQVRLCQRSRQRSARGPPPAGRGRACPGAARVDGGHGPAGPCDRLETEAGWSLHRACQSVARDSAKVHGKRGSPGMGQPSTAFSGETSSCLDRGRHPTDTRKVGANPRRAA